MGAVAIGLGGTALSDAPLPRPVLVTYASSQTDVVPLTATPLLERFSGRPDRPEPQSVATDPKNAPARVQTQRASRSTRQSIGPKWATPIFGRLTSRYGWRWGRAHEGSDIAAPIGTPVRATTAGTVASAGWSGGYGKLVTVRHSDGTVTAYAHLSSISASAGERVAAGQVVAYSGNTGRSTGPHLHFEVRRAGAQVNPLAWLAAHGIEL